MHVRTAAALVLALMIFGAAAAQAVGTKTTSASADVRTRIANAEELIRQENYREAVEVLKGVVKDSPSEADAYNLLGFSYRKSKDFEQAERNYKRALRIDPDHKGAIEYYGELFIQTDRREKAGEMLARLEKLCPDGCGELDDLRKAFAGSGGGSNW